MNDPLLEVEDLHIRYRTATGEVHAVNDASFAIGVNEYFGLVGESGCGKSTLAKAVMGGLDRNGEIVSGTITYKGEEIQDLSESALDESIRWKEIAFIPQAAMNSLDPLKRISNQAIEVTNKQTDWEESKGLEKLEELFDIVGLPQARVHDYPFQFSGGMKQRAIIALALLLEPSLIIADEPTTALDVIMQDKVLEYLHTAREDFDLSLLLITHDISVVFELCDQMAVMHGGQVAESGTTERIFEQPRHPYTILLQQAFPDIRHPHAELATIDGSPPALRSAVTGCTFADRCPWAVEECRQGVPPLENVSASDSHAVGCIRHQEMDQLAAEYLSAGRDERVRDGSIPATDEEPILSIDGLTKHFDQSTNIIDAIKQRITGDVKAPVKAVDGVDLELRPREVQGVIGESGCGKSTLMRLILGGYPYTDGEVRFEGRPVSEYSDAEWQELRRRIQIIFQDPFNTMNPHFTVREAVAEPLRIHDIEWDDERILDILEEVQLTPAEEFLHRKESQLSGGEKQRVAIARALAPDPDVILADEPVSMLDVSTQASILQLLSDLTDKHDVAMLYVSHDLSTVSYVCDRVNVMYLGRIVESAPTMEILEDPKHPYSKALIQSIPVPDPTHSRDQVDIPDTASDASNMPSGCRFKDRCPERMDVCDESPLFVPIEGEQRHHAACHLYYDHDERVGDAERPMEVPADE